MAWRRDRKIIGWQMSVIYVSGVAGDSRLRPKLAALCRGQKTTELLLSATSNAIPFNAGWRFLLWVNIQQYPIRASNAVT